MLIDQKTISLMGIGPGRHFYFCRLTFFHTVTVRGEILSFILCSFVVSIDYPKLSGKLAQAQSNYCCIIFAKVGKGNVILFSLRNFAFSEISMFLWQ